MIPGVTGIGECVKGLKTVAKVSDKIDDAVDAGKAIVKSSSKVLRENMIKAGIDVPDFANAAHHIVAGNARGVQAARDVLDKFNVKVNDAVNGVFLPIVKGVSDAAYHPSLHTKTYYDTVNYLLSKATCKEDVIYILIQIGNQLADGTFMK